MAAELMDAESIGLKHLSDEEAKFTVAEHGNFAARRDRSLVEYFAGSRYRLGERRRSAVEHHPARGAG